MNSVPQMIQYSFLVVVILASGCHQRKTSKAIGIPESITQEHLQIELQEIELQGPIANLLSLSWNIPVFENGMATEKKSELQLPQGFKTALNPVELAINLIRADPQLQQAIKAEYAGQLSVNRFGEVCEKAPCQPAQARTAGDTIVRKFFGYCLDGKVYAAETFSGPSATDNQLTEDDNSPMTLRYAGSLPQSYQPSITGCRERFAEFIKSKYAGPQTVITQLAEVETLSFIFSYVPGFSGTDNLAKGNTTLGTAEIVGDIATLGAASKLNIGWQSFFMSTKIYRKLKTGLQITAVVANTVRIGSLVQQIRSQGARFSDVPTVMLMIAETGYVLARIKIKPGVNTVLDKFEEFEDVLTTFVGQLTRKLTRVDPGKILNIYKTKFQGIVGIEELSRIRAAMLAGAAITFDDIHKFISNSILKPVVKNNNPQHSGEFLEIVDKNGSEWGFAGVPGMMHAVLHSQNALDWNSVLSNDLEATMLLKDSVVFFVGEAAHQMLRLDLDSGFAGLGTVIANNFRNGDVCFTDFDVFYDGTQSMVVVKKIEIIDESSRSKLATPPYANLKRVRSAPFGLAWIVDPSKEKQVPALVSRAETLSVIEWLYSPEKH